MSETVKEADSFIPEMNPQDVSGALSKAKHALEGVTKHWDKVRESLGKEMHILREANRNLSHVNRELSAEATRLSSELWARSKDLVASRQSSTLSVDTLRPDATTTAVGLLLAERKRQETLFGLQDKLPTGCGQTSERLAREFKAREACAAQDLTWANVLEEEVAEFLNAENEDDALEEVIQVSAVALAIAESIIRRRTK